MRMAKMILRRIGVMLSFCAGVANLITAFSSSNVNGMRNNAAVSTIRFGMVAATVIQEAEAVEVEAVGSIDIRLPTRGTRVRLFYPTTTATATAPNTAYAPYATDGRSMGRRFLLAPESSGCLRDAPLAVVGTGESVQFPPLLIYSHDIGSNMDSSTNLFRRLSAEGGGIIVAAVEHTDGTAAPSTIRPDGSELRASKYFMTERRQLARRSLELLEAADHLTPNRLLALGDGGLDYDEASSSSPEEVVDRPVVMLGGHGYGATSAIMAANGAAKNSTICGLILTDPTLGMGYGMLPPNKAYNRLPTLTFVSDKYHKAGMMYGSRTIHVQGSKHGNFEDAILWGAVPKWTRKVDPFQVHELMAESMATFLHTRDVDCAAASSDDRGSSLFERIR